MKAYLKYIGVVDKEDNIHHVEFTTGVNVITGRSSTGKSAMIEIFDYCMGSSEFTIPAGIITNTTDLYFIVLVVEDKIIVIGRGDKNSKKVFLKQESVLPNISFFKKEYFDINNFITLNNFKIQLGHEFGLTIYDTDIDLENKKFRKSHAKKERPSIRNITPFLLQHQNLIANKHSIFYRFDQKEKREQTIEQFKIFTGFVTQDYFTTKQTLAEKERELKSDENKQKSINEQIKFSSDKIDLLLKEYIAITGYQLFPNLSGKDILMNPSNYLSQIESIKINSNYESDEDIKQLEELKIDKNILYAKRRKLTFKLKEISSSVNYANKYQQDLNNIDSLEKQEIDLQLSKCPFCKTSNNDILEERNKLFDAINWLNIELEKAPLLLDSFESDKKVIELEISSINKRIENIYFLTSKLEKITKGLNKNKDLDEQALKVKLKIENLLENLLEKDFLNLDENIKRLKNEIIELETKLTTEFNVESKLEQAEKHINRTMKSIGKYFNFEESYSPIDLRFSVESFDLWYQKNKNERIYLRSMGSGANWLYSHLTLFMSLHKYFCSLGTKSIIPPILFLDQPSQVYFPTSIDITSEFNAKELKKQENKEEKTDEDLNAVSNLFNQMIKFCKNTLEETGIEPQIIITDHADYLALDNDIEFDSLVNGRRWRKRGFIEVLND